MFLKHYTRYPRSGFERPRSKFLRYFAYHDCKKVAMFYDRAGNQYEKVKQDLAGKLKQAIEKDKNGKRTGWTVTLESRNQGTILYLG